MRPFHTIRAKVYTDETMGIYRQSIDINYRNVQRTLFKSFDTLITSNIRLSYFEGMKVLYPGDSYSFYIEEDVETIKYKNVDNGSQYFPIVIYSYFHTFVVFGNSTPICLDNHQNWIKDHDTLKYQVNCFDYENDSIGYSLRTTMRALDSSDYQLPSNISIDAQGLIRWQLPIDTGTYLLNVRLFSHSQGVSYQERIITVPITQHLLSSNKKILLEDNHLQVFPNPTNNQLNIQFDYHTPNNTQIQIFDMVGRMVHQQAMTQQREQLNIGHLVSGMYLVRVVADGKVWTRKVIKN